MTGMSTPRTARTGLAGEREKAERPSLYDVPSGRGRQWPLTTTRRAHTADTGCASDRCPMTTDPVKALLAWCDTAHLTCRDEAEGIRQAAAIRAVVELHGPSSGFVRERPCRTCGAGDGPRPCTTLLELADGFCPGWRTA